MLYNINYVKLNNRSIDTGDISCGSTGYVALFKREDHHIMKMLAIRHQREDDY